MSKKKILVIDDEEGYRLIIKSALEPRGFEVLTAENAHLGIVSARKDQPDLIILDVHLPDKDGFHVAYDLKKDPFTTKIPIIILSARAKMKEVFDPAQIHCFIEKPLQLENLIPRVMEVLDPHYMHALIVGSRWIMMKPVKDLLESRGFGIIFVEEPIKALEEIASYHPPELIIASSGLQGMDIVTFCKEIRLMPEALKSKLVVYDLSNTLRLQPEKAKELAADLIISFTSNDDFLRTLKDFITKIY